MIHPLAIQGATINGVVVLIKLLPYGTRVYRAKP